MNLFIIHWQPCLDWSNVIHFTEKMHKATCKICESPSGVTDSTMRSSQIEFLGRVTLLSQCFYIPRNNNGCQCTVHLTKW